MNTVLTLYDRPEEWYQDTYVCCECETEFMTDDIPKFVHVAVSSLMQSGYTMALSMATEW